MWHCFLPQGPWSWPWPTPNSTGMWMRACLLRIWRAPCCGAKSSLGHHYQTTTRWRTAGRNSATSSKTLLSPTWPCWPSSPQGETVCRQARCLAGRGWEKGKVEVGEHGACCCSEGVGGIGPSGCKSSVLSFTQGRHARSAPIALQRSVSSGRH